MNTPSSTACLCRVAFLLFSLVGCRREGTAIDCQPACPSGTHCAESGCVSDEEHFDLAMAGADFGLECAPACGGAAPVCRNGTCVACAADADCPVGRVCKAIGQIVACVPGCADDSRCGGGAMKCCNSACIDTRQDSGNCGDCGAACIVNHAGATCAGGKCMLGSCARGWADCNANPADGCEVNLRDDAGNCTACGMTCSLPHAVVGCASGCYVRACNFGWDDCNAEEKDGCETNVAGDVRNCGGCGASCPGVPRAKVACVNAACQLQSCDAGYSDCDGNVANGCEVAINTDAANCGGCGMKCAQGLVCVQGGCTCPNCNLPNARSACVNFQCVVGSCNQGFGDCDGLPQNGCERTLSTDISHCGMCGNKCAQGLVCTNGGCTCPQCNFPNASSKCINNVCVLDQCVPGFGDCNHNPADGCELDLSKDPANCGACANQCPQNMAFCLMYMCSAFVLFPQAQYNTSQVFKDGAITTAVGMAWDGSSYWSVSGGNNAGQRLAKYDANGNVLMTYAPGIDFRSVFTVGGKGMQLYSRGFSSAQIQVQAQPGVFQNSVTLVGGVLDAQSSMCFNEDGTEFVAMNGGTVTRWTANGALIGTVQLQGFGNMNNENVVPQNRGIVKAGGYYLTYSASVLSAWDANGVRQKTTTLVGAGTTTESYWSYSYSHDMVWIIDGNGGMWRGYNVGL